MRKRDFLENQAVKQNSHQAWNNYKKARNEKMLVLGKLGLLSLTIALRSIVVI